MQLVNRIFTDDMDTVRKFAREAIDTYLRSEMVASVPCSTFKTHDAMEKCMHYEIDDHQLISSEFVKFLAINSSTRGQGRSSDDMMKKMEDRLDDIEKVTKGSKSVAGMIQDYYHSYLQYTTN